MANLIKTLKHQADNIFPRTKVKAVSDDDGVSLNVLLDDKVTISQGNSHANQFVVTDANGNITTRSIEFLEGGDY